MPACFVLPGILHECSDRPDTRAGRHHQWRDHALLALSILLVFTVTRVLFIPQGEFVAFGALTMASLQAGKPVALVWLLLAFALAEAVCDLLAWRKRPARMRVWRIAAKAVYP